MPLFDDDATELHLKLPAKAAADMRHISEQTGYSLHDLARFGLAFVQFAFKEQEQNHTIAVLDEKGMRIKDLVLPSTSRSAVQKILAEEEESHSSSLAQAIADLDPDRAGTL